MSAVISADGLYRMRLDRVIADSGPVYALCGINPLTAGAEINDATIRKEIGFVTRWGGSRLIKFNVFNYRSTDVRKLATIEDPYGPNRNAFIDEIISAADILIPCWGNQSKIPDYLRPDLKLMLKIMRLSGKPVKVFGFTKSGDPMHPLMLSYDTPLQDLYP